MTIDEAAQTLWDYMLMHQPHQKADVMLVPGNSDLRTIEHAAKLYKEGWAPIMVCSGSGSINAHRPGRERFTGRTEAEVFREVAIERGVPDSAIVIETESQNTNDNLRFSLRKLAEHGIVPKSILAVMKPYMERRMIAIAGIYCPEVDFRVTSPSISLSAYPYGSITMDYVINMIVGDLQRIIEYPKKGWQIAQDVPPNVMQAYEFLLSQGYVERLAK
ncbi:MAG TPA: YdcF family protein [Candidatus Paceibacterota bacterium]